VIKVKYKDGINNYKAIYTQRIGDGKETTDAASKVSDGDLLTQLTPSDKEKYLSVIKDKVWATMKTSYEITLPKNSFGSSDAAGTQGETKTNPDDFKPKPIDETEMNKLDGVSKLYWYNLPIPEGKQTTCLKVKYVAQGEDGTDATKGFCYTSPTAWADVKSAGWMVAATAVDVTAQVLIGAFTGGTGTVSMAGSVASCMASNYVMWYGEQAVTNEKQASYWPNNLYFGSYFR
jgi:hypothetical protein